MRLTTGGTARAGGRERRDRLRLGYLSGVEKRVLRAAGRAGRGTGAAVITHASMHPVGLAQLDVLQEEGVPPTAWSSVTATASWTVTTTGRSCVGAPGPVSTSAVAST